MGLELLRKQQSLDCMLDVNQMVESIKYQSTRCMNSAREFLTSSMQVITHTQRNTCSCLIARIQQELVT